MEKLRANRSLDGVRYGDIDTPNKIFFSQKCLQHAYILCILSSLYTNTTTGVNTLEQSKVTVLLRMTCSIYLINFYSTIPVFSVLKNPPKVPSIDDSRNAPFCNATDKPSTLRDSPCLAYSSSTLTTSLTTL